MTEPLYKIRQIAYQQYPENDSRRWWVVETTVWPDGRLRTKMVHGPYLLESEAKEALDHA